MPKQPRKVERSQTIQEAVDLESEFGQFGTAVAVST